MAKQVNLHLNPVNTDDYAGPTIVEAHTCILNNTVCINSYPLKTFKTRDLAIAYIARMAPPRGAPVCQIEKRRGR